MSVDPIARFLDVFARAAETAPPPADHSAAALASVSGDGRPAARMVLVRHVDPHGFLFFTNYESRKAGELAAQPSAALCFYWFWIEQQVRIEGRVERATPAESDDYFATRPRGSQIGAWASLQSRPLTDRKVLEDRYRALEEQYDGRPVPRPPFWGGYRLRPERMEFWTAGTFRLHERHVFMRTADGRWTSTLLYP